MADLSALLPVDEALDTVIARAKALVERRPREVREVGLWDASGLVLAEDVYCDRDLPPFHKAMMDGFAVRSADVVGPSTTLKVVGEVAAGASFDGTVGPGEAVQIMTGAPMPAGADAVMMVERTAPGPDGAVVLSGDLRPGQNVGQKGEDARAGSVVAEAGRVIESLTAGVLGSVGASRVKVYRRPRVTVLTTGDELVALEETPGPSQIRDSNRRTLMSLLERELCRVVDGGIVADDPVATREAIRQGLDSDVLVLSGGVSAGVYDLVAQALADEGVRAGLSQGAHEAGQAHPLRRARRRPGVWPAGQPRQRVRDGGDVHEPGPARLGRRPQHHNWTLELPLVGTVPPSKGRTTFQPGDLLRGDDGVTRVRMRSWNGSADHISYARADVLIRREAGSPGAVEGEAVKVVLPHALASW